LNTNSSIVHTSFECWRVSVDEYRASRHPVANPAATTARMPTRRALGEQIGGERRQKREHRLIVGSSTHTR
jgi:hypothetical protein